MIMDLRPFHLAIPVKDLKESVDFYEKVLGCKRGRKDKQWVDYNLFGHQLVLHEDKNLIIIDLSSKNGTYINNEKISGPTKINKNDVVSIGNYKCSKNDIL